VIVRSWPGFFKNDELIALDLVICLPVNGKLGGGFGDGKGLAFAITGQAKSQAICRIKPSGIACFGGKENQRPQAHQPRLVLLSTLNNVVSLTGDVGLGLADYLPLLSGRSLLPFGHSYPYKFCLSLFRWQCLYFLPLPHQQGSLRLSFLDSCWCGQDFFDFCIYHRRLLCSHIFRILCVCFKSSLCLLLKDYYQTKRQLILFVSPSLQQFSIYNNPNAIAY
jgi:hypothetical protein